MASHDQTDTQAVAPLSRRDLFIGAGATAGALAALAAVGGVAYAPAAQAALSKTKKYFANNVFLELDGASAGRLITAEGGEPVLVPAGTAIGAEKFSTQTTLRYEPLSLVLGDMSPAMYDWIGKSTIGSAIPHQVQVITTGADNKEVYRMVMQNVRLTEIRLDEFNAALNISDAQQPVRFNVKMAPGLSAHQFGGKAIVNTPIVQKVKLLQRSNYRFYIQGLETATARTSSVDSIGLLARADGTLAPTPIKFAIPFSDAGPLFAWMQDTLAGKGGLRQAELQMLTPDFKNVAASVAFRDLMIVRISSPAEASNGGFQHAEIECLPAGVTFNMGELLK